MDSKENSKEDDPPAPVEDTEMNKEGTTKEEGEKEEEINHDIKFEGVQEEANAAPATISEEAGEREIEEGGESNADAIDEGNADRPKEEETYKPKDEANPKQEDSAEGDVDAAKEMPQEGDIPASPAEEMEDAKQEQPPELEGDPNAAYHQQMHYGYHPGMQHHPPPPYYGGYYPPPPHHAYYPPPPPPMDQDHGGGGIGSPGPEGMHHYYPPPPPYGYPPQHHYAPYPPASPVKSPGSNREYPTQHQPYFPVMTPPRYNHHEHDGGGSPGGGDHVSKKDEDMQATEDPEEVGNMGGPSEVISGNHNPIKVTTGASNLKVYVKPKGVNIPPEILERRARKNANSRARAAKHRARVAIIEQRPQLEWTEEEHKMVEVNYKRRNQKNDRSRERALEKKAEIDRILNKPENERAKIEMQFLKNALGARSRKNEGDRVRRRKLKELGVAHIGRNHKQYTTAASPSKGGSGGGHYPQQQYAGYPPPPYGYGGYPPPPPPPHYGMMGPPSSPYRGYASPGEQPQHPGYPPPPEGGDPYAPTNAPPPLALPHLIPGEGHPPLGEGPPATPPPGIDREGGQPPE